MFGIQEIDAATLRQWMEQGEDFRLVDIRTEAEVAQGVIEGAEWIPMHLIPLRIEEFRNGPRTVFYCRSGNRSAQVCAFLAQQGAGEHCINLQGGIIGWARAGYPVAGRETLKVA